MNFYDQFVRPKKTPEINSGEIRVEKAGYIPAEKQIAQLMQAGVRLGQYRKEMYDTETDDGEIDPTRGPDFDLADASTISRALDQKKEAAKAAKAAAEAAAKQVMEDQKKGPEEPVK
nr:MAG: hypothetical protein [Microvirus sp.]